MGYVVKALAQIGRDEADEAIQAFDLAFGNSNPHETSLLLLIKVCDPCTKAGFWYEPLSPRSGYHVIRRRETWQRDFTDSWFDFRFKGG